ncbi:unnamed protein product [Rotaria sp. Silwood1]|nr:unnamed protein product [Rotaria sp. Silwood1]
MLFSFQWQYLYIPLCPVTLSDVLKAPCPFIIGIVSRYFDICEPSADVICVELDSNIITGGTKEQKHWSVKIFPKKANEIKFQVLNTYQQRLYELPTHLKRNHNDSELHLQIVQLERNMETRIRDIFLRFMCTCFYGYKRFLRQTIHNRENKLNQDDMLSSIFSTLAGSIKDITESSFFPRMLLKKSPSMDGLTDNKIVPTTNSNNNNINNIAVLETAKKRSLSNTYDIHSKLDYSTLQSITHETARSDAGILMTTIDIEIVDVGMLSYRLRIAPRSSQMHNTQQSVRRSILYPHNQTQLNSPIK